MNGLGYVTSIGL